MASRRDGMAVATTPTLLQRRMARLPALQPYKEYASECSYCRATGSDGRVAYGANALRLTVDDYDALLERTWLRSGKFVYQPVNERTCCPNLAIRLDALQFQPSQSQLRVARRLNRYLRGERDIRGAVLAQQAKLAKQAAAKEGKASGGAGPSDAAAGAGLSDARGKGLSDAAGGAGPGDAGGADRAAAARVKATAPSPAPTLEALKRDAVREALCDALASCVASGALPGGKVRDGDVRVAAARVQAKRGRRGGASQAWDGSSNVALLLSRACGEGMSQARAFAEALAAAARGSGRVAEAAVGGPGYLNVRLAPAVVAALEQRCRLEGAAGSDRAGDAKATAGAAAGAAADDMVDDDDDAAAAVPAEMPPLARAASDDSNASSTGELEPIVAPDISRLLEPGPHELKVTLRRPVFDEEAYQLYVRYNTIVHDSKRKENGRQAYEKHLVLSPLVPESRERVPLEADDVEAELARVSDDDGGDDSDDMADAGGDEGDAGRGVGMGFGFGLGSFGLGGVSAEPAPPRAPSRRRVGRLVRQQLRELGYPASWARMALDHYDKCTPGAPVDAALMWVVDNAELLGWLDEAEAEVARRRAEPPSHDDLAAVEREAARRADAGGTTELEEALGGDAVLGRGDEVDDGHGVVGGWNLAMGYGTFHQEYRIDGVLVAVSCLDILPRRLASVYFFYNPDLRCLELGKYSALLEAAWNARARLHAAPRMRWYDMNYYVHTCPKMNYKRAYRPSELLCPRHFRWVPLSAALPRLDAELCPALVDLTEEEAEDEAYVNDMMKGAATQELVMELDGGSRYLLFKHCSQRSVDMLAPIVDEYLDRASPHVAGHVLMDPRLALHVKSEERREAQAKAEREAAAREAAEREAAERAAAAAAAADGSGEAGSASAS